MLISKDRAATRPMTTASRNNAIAAKATGAFKTRSGTEPSTPRSPAQSALSPMNLDLQFLGRTAALAGNLAMQDALKQGVEVVGMRDGRPIVIKPDGTERVVEWTDLSAPEID